ncbi:ATP-binding protein [Aeromonas sp. 19NY04SH05-1]|uniref:ATP-binding protein n=1 Tax=Aeromonas sp. 19NY04SH05-1 TaxID=2920537 RepID=A0AAU6T5P8_9GAMM
MYKIQSVIIENFWGKFNAHCNFDDNVNIIIGRNGTGKTTFMNILQSVLSVDIDGIMNTNFDRIEIKLRHNSSIKTIKAKKIENPNFPIQVLEYQISQSKFQVRLIPSDDRRISPGFRRRVQEECEQIKTKLTELVTLSSLSVYRLRNGQDYEVRDKNGTRVIAPVDYKLGELLQDLTHYQLDLSQKARDVATKLQKDVLASILYSKEDSRHKGYILSYDKEKEKTDLIAAYKRLRKVRTSL